MNDLIIKKYVSLIPLWTGAFIEERLSNAPVERYFGIIKNIILKTEKNVKCSRVIRKIREYTLSVCKESDYDIPSKKCATTTTTKKYGAEILKQKEVWRKPGYTPKYFVNQSLSNYAANTDETTCIYCGKGILDITAKWVQCDMCDGWVHADCEKADEDSFTGPFYCKFCEEVRFPSKINPNENVTTRDKSIDLKRRCEEFLDML